MKWAGIIIVPLLVAVGLWLGGKALLNSSVQRQYDILKTNPNRSEDQNDEAVLAKLRAKGSDSTKATDIVFYLYIPVLHDALTAGAALKQHGYTVDVQKPLGKLSDGSYESRYSVVAHIEEAPSLENLRINRAIFKTLARQYNGEYDGWEAAIAQ